MFLRDRKSKICTISEEKKEDGGLIPAPGLFAAAAGIALVAVLRRRR